ncbi:MAG: hypothetical protein HY292_27785 [Planctomycetes bacterium]|nr:hypothetical protein [Planctomycetota bacterium]
MSQSIRWIAVLVVLAVMASIFVAYRTIRPSPGPASSEAASSGAPASPGAPNDAVTPPADSTSDDVADTLEERAAKRHQKTQAVFGTIVVVDEHGAPHADESGSFILLNWRGRYPDRETVRVEAGKWQTMVRPGAPMSVTSIRLSNRDATWDDDGTRFRNPESGGIDVHAHWRAPSTLHVRDAATQGELADVELVEGSSWYGGDIGSIHPGRIDATRIAAKNERSPIDLEKTLATAREVAHASEQNRIIPLFVRSPGFAWKGIDVDLSAGTKRFLDLVPGGDLDVHLAGEVVPSGAHLRLRRAEGLRDAPYAEVSLAQDHDVAIESMVPGAYVASVEIGDAWREPVVLGSAHVDVTAHARAKVEIVIGRRPAGQSVRIGGTIRVSKSWLVGGLVVDVTSLGAAPDDPARRRTIEARTAHSDGPIDAFGFGVDGVAPGRYAIELRQPPYGFVVDVGPEGRNDLVLEIPPPGHVSLRVIDASTGRDARVDDVVWYRAAADEGVANNVESAKHDPKTGRFEFEAPQTEIVVRCNTAEFASEPLHLTVHEGVNEATLTVAAAYRMRLRVVDGETAIPWSASWNVQPAQVEGDGTASYSAPEGDGVEIGVTQPGRYRFAFPKLDGYLPVPEQLVDVEVGKLTEHVIHLEREH